MVSSHLRLLFTIAAFCTAVPAVAQTSDPGELEKLLKNGDTISFVDVNGAETRAQVERVFGGMLEFRPITPGDSSNQYRVTGDIKTFPIDQIAGVTRTDALGAGQVSVYERRDSFGSLHRRLRVGEVVRVTQRSGDETVGKVTEISPSGLVIATRKANPRDGSGRPRYEWIDARTFAPAAVEKITREAHIWDGAVKGAAIALASMLIATRGCYGCEGIGYVYLMSAGIGAGIGLGIDAAIPARAIYRRR
jgi:hypothetical protein